MIVAIQNRKNESIVNYNDRNTKVFSGRIMKSWLSEAYLKGGGWARVAFKIFDCNCTYTLECFYFENFHISNRTLPEVVLYHTTVPSQLFFNFLNYDINPCPHEV